MCSTKLLGRSVAAAFLSVLSVVPGLATSHVFVRNADGVWLASDSMVVHREGSEISILHECKVAVSRNQLFFNTGNFRSFSELTVQQSELPFASMSQTLQWVSQLLSINHQDLTRNVGYDSEAVIVGTGVLQVENSVFRVKMLEQNDNFQQRAQYVREDFQMGIPHGFGLAVNEANLAANSDSDLRSRLMENPKQELLKILMREAAMRPASVSGPYTVYLLHPDGSVSDFSDEPLCVVPMSARH